MQPPKFRSALSGGVLWLNGVLFLSAACGGSGLNTAVIINQSSSNSLALGNYFCERRQVPPDNVLFINWPGGNISWTNGDFKTNLLNPLLAMLAARQLTNQIDYVVLCMDIPFQTLNGSAVNSTTSALFYGLKGDSGPDWVGSTNSYAASEQVFRQAPPASAPGFSFLTTMLTGYTLAQAEQLVDQGVNSDASFPTAAVVLAKSSDPLRNIRYTEFDNAIFNTRLCGNYFVERTNSDSSWWQAQLLGCELGLANFNISPNTFAPGAMADSLTSFGGIIFGPNGQTTALAFTGAGAAGSYGTVVEPSPSLDKFPNPQAYFYQARGFSLAECYYQSLNVPYEGLIVGEPLAAPFAHPASGQWTNISGTLSGTTQLALQFSASDSQHPLQQFDLFVDGKYHQTLTNLGPQAGNALTVTLNGYPLNYTVGSNATLNSVAADLAALINSPANPNVANIAAWAHGDRVELHVTSTNPVAVPFYITEGNTTNLNGRYYRISYLPGPVAPQLFPVGRDLDGAFRMQVESPASVPFVVQASTNLADWLPIFTNLQGGSLEFVDVGAPAYSRRFYRLNASIPDYRPALSALSPGGSGIVKLHVDGPPGLRYLIQASTNFAQWTPILTNLSGGPLDFVDAQAASIPSRFYRAQVLPPQITPLGSPTNGGPSFRIDGAALPYLVQVSTDLVHWTALFTNLTIGEIQTAVNSSAGSAAALATFLTVSGATLLDSQATGRLPITLLGMASAGEILQLSITKTNGALVNLMVTNQPGATNLANLAEGLYCLVNTTPALQGPDGVAAADLFTNFSRYSGFNLYARNAGLGAAAVQVQISTSGTVVTDPQGGPVPLSANLSDLQPRSHLYVRAGAAHLGFPFSLDTTGLADGFHVLTAVAYEGSNVRTQTRITLPVVIQNSTLNANLNFLDLGATAPVQATYHLQVVANTNNVNSITLFSTGGAISTITNQPSPTFVVAGPSLGLGLHPFYAVVQTASGLTYRTQTQWSRLIGP